MLDELKKAKVIEVVSRVGLIVLNTIAIVSAIVYGLSSQTTKTNDISFSLSILITYLVAIVLVGAFGVGVAAYRRDGMPSERHHLMATRYAIICSIMIAIGLVGLLFWWPYMRTGDIVFATIMVTIGLISQPMAYAYAYVLKKLSKLGPWEDDGQALTPPMGFLSYTGFDTDENCEKYPHDCVNEQLYKDMADRLVADGFYALGYRYVNIDDRWSELKRDPQTRRLLPNKKRFPGGIKALADYMHAKGLKLGIYGDIGNATCSNTYPGQNNHEPGGHDYFDVERVCKRLTPQLSHKMLMVCEWPFFQYVFDPHIDPNYDAIAKTCHCFRNYKDVMDSWASVDEIIKYYGDYNDLFIKHNDELTIGNSGLSWHQSRTQMAMWCMWSSPLLMSTDLRALKPEMKTILQNKALIAVNQDKHGIMAKKVYADGDTQVWVKPVEPVMNGQWSYVITYLNRHPMGHPTYMAHKVSDMIPTAKPGTKYEIHDLFIDEGKEVLGSITTSDTLELLVHPSGSVRVVKLLVQ
ncbi:unnamed protein product [Medioppia subpectinata]|uniref:Alpha-galactosidase n=1 Tax=Medioppia subpectinata TaxID=1979941 RepID=A0A7R9L1P8_9ACAR|nr:unnamed protein product [Medioppia subpectinata]CAG2113699.1 unnamed protein product [Medioppia subpectinata]